MKTTEEKKENNQTILDLVACFNPTGSELEQYKAIIKVMNAEFLHKYLKVNALNKDVIMNTITELRYYAHILEKRDELFYYLSGIANRLLSAKSVDVREILDSFVSKAKEYKGFIAKKIL